MRRLSIGIAWAAIGGALAVADVIDLWRIANDSKYGWRGGFFEPSFWASEIGIIFFLAAAAVVGGAVVARRRWGLIGMRVLAPVALIYGVAYDVAGDERAGWVSLLALALTGLVAVSVWYAFRSGSEFAT
jgi:hypothetical protein